MKISAKTSVPLALGALLAFALSGSAFAAEGPAACSASQCLSDEARFNEAQAQWLALRARASQRERQFQTRVEAFAARAKALPIALRPGSPARLALERSQVRFLGQEGGALELFAIEPYERGGRSAVLQLRRIEKKSLFSGLDHRYGWAGRESLSSQEASELAAQATAALQAALPAGWSARQAGDLEILVSWPKLTLAQAGAAWDQWRALEKEYAEEKGKFLADLEKGSEAINGQAAAMASVRPLSWQDRARGAAQAEKPDHASRLLRPRPDQVDPEAARIILSSF